MLGYRNLHWGRTLENKMVLVRHQAKVNYTIPFQYNYTEYQLSQEKRYWDEVIALGERQNNSSHRIRYAENQFLRKTKMLGDMMMRAVKQQSFTTVIVISSIFLFLTLAITIAVIVFCRKKNTVFALQKSEQDDNDYELDDINTDMEYTETDFDSETDSLRSRTRSISQTAMESDGEGSPLHCPTDLPPERMDMPAAKFPVCVEKRGGYHRIMVHATMERHPALLSNTDDCDVEGEQHPVIYNEAKATMLRNLYRKYYGMSDKDNPQEDDEKMPLHDDSPSINVSYADNPTHYEQLQCIPQVVVSNPADNTDYLTDYRPNTSNNNLADRQQEDDEDEQLFVEVVCHEPDTPQSTITLSRVEEEEDKNTCDRLVTRTDSGSSSERTDSEFHGSDECLIHASRRT